MTLTTKDIILNWSVNPDHLILTDCLSCWWKYPGLYSVNDWGITVIAAWSLEGGMLEIVTPSDVEEE